MGAEIGARAISHLEEVSDAGLKAMADAGTVAVLLPTTAYMLRLRPPPARQMIEAGVAVALGSDFNPNAHCLAMVKCIVYLFITIIILVGLMRRFSFIVTNFHLSLLFQPRFIEDYVFFYHF